MSYNSIFCCLFEQMCCPLSVPASFLAKSMLVQSHMLCSYAVFAAHAAKSLKVQHKPALSLEPVQHCSSSHCNINMQVIRLAHSAAVYASKSFELDDGRRLMMNWVFETSVGCSGQCSAGTAFTIASVSLHCLL